MIWKEQGAAVSSVTPLSKNMQTSAAEF